MKFCADKLNNVTRAWKLQKSEFAHLLNWISNSAGQAQQYLSDYISIVSASSGRQKLRLNGSVDYDVPRMRTKFRV